MGKRVVVTLRCQRRPALLDRVISAYLDLAQPGVEIAISLMADRPTPEVDTIIDRWRPDLAQTFDCPFPICSHAQGNLFREAARVQYARIRQLEPDFVIFADDDRWFEPGFRQELKTATEDDSVDLWYARSLFFWEPRRIRTDFFEHNSVALYRYDPDDQFSLTRHLQAPERLHDRACASGRIRQLKARLLDFGYCGVDERLTLFHIFKEAGRLDGVVLHLLDSNPKLETYVPPESDIN